MADLEADVDEPPSDFEEDWEEAPAEAQENDAALGAASSTAEESTVSTRDETDGGGGDGADDDNHSISLSQLGGISLQLDDALASPIPDTTLHVPRATPVSIATGLSVPSGSKDQATPPGSASQYALARAETAAPDGPMTPRNDAGPFILDGSAGRAERRTGIGNLESVVQED
ncbi:MAG: hypothetical protein M1822_001793 [Bathelium mastoideum]|nr:MAG: hypothetical protein M1822_001793 [Bathelium mastoideum]